MAAWTAASQSNLGFSVSFNFIQSSPFGSEEITRDHFILVTQCYLGVTPLRINRYIVAAHITYVYYGF